MQKKISLNRTIIGILIGLIIIGIILKNIDMSNVLVVMQSASLYWILVSSFMLVIFYFIRALRWKIILRNRYKTPFLFWVGSIGYLANNFLPPLGEFIKPYVLKSKQNTEFFEGFSSVLIERILDIFVLVIIGFAGFLLISSNSVVMPHWFTNTLIMSSAIIIIILLILFLGSNQREILLSFCERTFQLCRFPQRIIEKIIKSLNSLAIGAGDVGKSPRTFLNVFMFTCLAWTANSLSLFFIFKGLNYTIPISIVFLGLVFIALSQAIPNPPGYIGTYEGVGTAVFLALGIKNIELALAVVLISHVLVLIITTILGLTGLLMLKLSFRDIIKSSTKSASEKPIQKA